MQRLPGLDALRGVAALVVVIGHALNSTAHASVAGRFYIAVDVFFVLSGFVMAKTYEHRMPSPIRFLAKRAKRLWLTMLAGGVLGIISYLSEPPDQFVTLAIAGLFLVPTTIQVQVFPLNAPTWSIVSELFANTLHGAGAFRIRPVPLSACGLFLVGCTYFSYGAIGAGPFRGDFLGSLPRAAGSYMIGIAMFRSWDRLPKLPFWPVYLLPGLLLIPGFGGPIDLALVVFIPAIAVMCALSGSTASPLLLLGAASFPLYAVHEPIQRMVQSAGGDILLSVLVPTALTCGWVLARDAYKRSKSPVPQPA